MAKAREAIPIPTPSKEFQTSLKPKPFSPYRFSFGTLTLLNITEQISHARIPILFSWGPK
jgi:hypothetical protein